MDYSSDLDEHILPDTMSSERMVNMEYGMNMIFIHIP